MKENAQPRGSGEMEKVVLKLGLYIHNSKSYPMKAHLIEVDWWKDCKSECTLEEPLVEGSGHW